MIGFPLWFGAAIAALTGFAILSFSDRFGRYGLAGWKLSLLGMTLVFVAFLAKASMTISSFAQLFRPAIPAVVSYIADMLTIVGSVVMAMSMFAALRRIARDKDSEKLKESELKLLGDLKDMVFEKGTLVEVLGSSINEISRAFGNCGAAVFLLNPARQELYLTSSANLERSFISSLEKISLGSDMISRTQKTSRTHSVGRLSESDTFTQNLLAPGKIESALAAPLNSRSGPIGVIVVFGQMPYQFTRRESDMLSSAASLLGPVVATFRMEREIRLVSERSAADAENARRQNDIIGSLANGTRSDNLGVLLEYSEDILRSDGAVIASRDEAGTWEIVKSTDNSPFGDKVPASFARHLNRSVESGKPLLIRSTSDEANPSRFLLFPVVSGPGGAALVASVSSEREAFSQDEVSRMQLVLRLLGLVLGQRSVRGSADASEVMSDMISQLLAAQTAQDLATGFEKSVFSMFPEYDAGMFLTLDNSKTKLRLAASFGYENVQRTNISFDATCDLWSRSAGLRTGKVFRERKEIENVFLALSREELAWFMARNGGRGLPEYFAVVPLEYRGVVGYLFMEGSESERPGSEISAHCRSVFDVVACRLKELSSASDKAIRIEPGTVSASAFDALNQINNILTGVIGKAQLLGFGLKGEHLKQKDGVLQNLDMVADEAFQAGELVRALQRAIREENTPTSEATEFSLSDVVRSISVVRFGNSPDLHYLRDNMSVSFEADLSPSANVTGDANAVRALLSELLQYVWDDFDSGERMWAKVIDRGERAYLIVSERALDDSEITLESSIYRPIGTHPDLSRSESLQGLSQLMAGYCEQELADGARVFFLRFDRGAIAEEPSMESFRILAIDDQEIIRELLTGMLDQLGYQVDVCSSGQEGLRLFDNGGYDLVITDIGLPDLDGWQVAAKIRERQPGIPIIMISGWGLGQEVERANRMGIDFVLPKPFRLENLSELVEKVRSRRATA
jgi:CheY-like chemotaxis protein